MKFCEKCGKELADEAVVCMGCGCAVSNIETGNTTYQQEPTVPKEPFSSKQSVTAIILAGIGAVLPIVGIILSFLLGSWLNMLLCAICLAVSIVGLVFAIKAKKARATDNLAVIAIIIAILGIFISAIAGVVYTVITIIAAAYLATYLGIIITAILATFGMAA